MTGRVPANPLALDPVVTTRHNSADEVAVAVVGCGAHSTSSILPAIRYAAMRLIAVCDLDADRAELARRQFGAEKAYQSVDEMLARPDLDAVIVVGPPDLHVSAGIAALETGRHVFVEKPPARSLADAQRLLQAGKAAHRQVMVGFMKRRASAYRLVRQIMLDDEFGSVTSVQLTYAHWPVAGLRLHLLDMSIHALDLARWLAGDPSRMSVYKRPIGDNHVVALTLEQPGVVTQLDLSAFQPGVQERLVVTGQGAFARVDNMTEVVLVRQAAGAPAEAPNNRVTSLWRPEFAIPDSENDRLVLQGYATEMIAFADAIREGRPVDPSIDDGIAAMRLIEVIVDAPNGLSIVEIQFGWGRRKPDQNGQP
jgi:myo-inositol 2-dehydrogenase/D-chiro-inositol 1-dehydrogenase